MNDRLFSRPLFVRAGKYIVQEIATIGDAIDFLSEWPECERDIVHETALRACIEAHDGLKPLDAARNAIRGFARKKGILENPAEAMPWIADAMSKGGRASA